jgi:hypothetical protein
MHSGCNRGSTHFPNICSLGGRPCPSGIQAWRGNGTHGTPSILMQHTPVKGHKRSCWQCLHQDCLNKASLLRCCCCLLPG